MHTVVLTVFGVFCAGKFKFAPAKLRGDFSRHDFSIQDAYEFDQG
jgi:hypothetical protein